MTGPDLRAAARHSYEWKATFGERDLAQMGFTRDVSEVGALIATTALPKIGALLRVRFDAPSPSRPVMLAQVVRHTKGTPRSIASAFAVKLISDRGSMRELIESAQQPPSPATPRPMRETVQLVSEKEFLQLRQGELGLGGLTFTPAKAVSINTTTEVEVLFRWTGRTVTVRGRVVRCDEQAGRFSAILLVDDLPATLAKLDEAARGS